MSFDVGYANYDTVEVQGSVSMPLSDKVAFNVAGVYRDQGEGWGDNITTGGEKNFNDYEAMRTKWLFAPSDSTTIKFSADYSEGKSDFGIPDNADRRTVILDLSTFSTGLGPVSFYDSRSGFEPFVEDESFGASLRIEHELSFMDVLSLTAYHEAEGMQRFDADFQAAPALSIDLFSETEFMSQELQFTSKEGGPLDWIVGLYASRQEANCVRNGVACNIKGFFIAPAVIQEFISFTESSSYAVYSQVTFPVFNESNHLTIGGRQTWEELEGNGSLRIDGVFDIPGTVVDSDDSISKFTYKVAFDHAFNDDVMTYASFSTGFKSGAYNTLPMSPEPVDAETMEALEFGVKSELFGNRLRLNAAVFHNEIDKPQVVLIFGNVQTLQNADSAEVNGFELSAEGKVNDQLTVRFNGQWLDHEYKSFENAPFAFRIEGLPFGNTAYVAGDASGNSLPRAPDLTLNFGFDYQIPTEMGDLLISANYYYNDGFFATPDLQFEQESYELVDLSAQLTLPGDQWSVTLWGQNLTESKYYSKFAQQDNIFGNSTSPGAPRTYGVRVAFRL